jgi:hypothetical protein
VNSFRRSISNGIHADRQTLAFALASFEDTMTEIVKVAWDIANSRWLNPQARVRANPLQIYQKPSAISTNGATPTAPKTEAFRTSNMALKTTWKESGKAKKIKWYTADNPCRFCEALNGKAISIDSNFFNNGDSLTVGEGDDANYGDVGAPPLHPNCQWGCAAGRCLTLAAES